MSETSREALSQVREAGDDVSLQKEIAALLADEPLTNREIADELSDYSVNSIQPRVNELVLMGCVERDGKRENPTGRKAYVNHLTPRGEDFLAGHIDPEPEKTVSDHKKRVVNMARLYLDDEVDLSFLRMAVQNHDAKKKRLDPDWEPPKEP